MTTPTRACLATTILLVAGCSSFGRVLEERVADLGDALRFSTGVSLGLYLEAEATSFLHPAAGIADLSLAPRGTVGWDSRRRVGEVRSAAFPALIIGWPIYGTHETAAGYESSHPYWRGFVSPWILAGHRHVAARSHSLLALHHLVPHPRLAEARKEREEADTDDSTSGSSAPWSDGSWVGFSGTALFWGLDAGFNVLELADFFAGWIGWDPLADDDRGQQQGVGVTPIPTRGGSRAPQ